jgi:nuclear GTP-binding protein
MKRIYLIDCPGVVYPHGDTETDIVLKGVVRVENIPSPEDHVEEVLRRVKKEFVERTYKIQEWTDHIDFLEKLATKTGKLNRGGESNISSAAKMVLNDFQRGKLPYYVKPPGCDNEPLENQDELDFKEKRNELENDSEITTNVDEQEEEEEKEESDEIKNNEKKTVSIRENFRKQNKSKEIKKNNSSIQNVPKVRGKNDNVKKAKKEKQLNKKDSRRAENFKELRKNLTKLKK